MSKIRELAIKAGMISSEYNGFDRCNLDAAEQEFARLLIEEACQAMNPMLRDMISRGEAVQLIKKQFYGDTYHGLGLREGTIEDYREAAKWMEDNKVDLAAACRKLNGGSNGST